MLFNKHLEQAAWTTSGLELGCSLQAVQILGLRSQAGSLQWGVPSWSTDAHPGELLNARNITSGSTLAQLHTVEGDLDTNDSMANGGPQHGPGSLWIAALDWNSNEATLSLLRRNPKAVEIGMAVLHYLWSNRGGIHYPREVMREWGPEGTLKVRHRSTRIEVFAGIFLWGGQRWQVGPRSCGLRWKSSNQLTVEPAALCFSKYVGQ